MISLLLVACGGSTPSAPEPAPAPEPPALVAEPAPVAAPEPAAAAMPADGAAVLALLPADAPREALVNELSGETYGTGVTLSAPMDVGGLPCGAGQVAVTEDSWGCTTAGRFTWGEYTWRAGAWVGRYYGTGTPYSMVLDELEPPRERLDFQGVPCTVFIHLTASGKLQHCMLGADHTWGAVTIKSGSDIGVDEAGALTEATIYDPHTIGGTEYAGGILQFKDGAVTEYSDGAYGE